MKKRADGRYSRSIVIGYDVDGKQLRKTFYAKTKWELDKKVTEWKELHEKGMDQQRDITFAKLTDLWLEYQEGAVSEQSYHKYVLMLKALLVEVGQIKCTQLSLSDLVKLRNKRVAAGIPQRFNEDLRLLRQILSYGMKLDILAQNVAQKIDPIKDISHKERRAFTQEERDAILCADLPLDWKAMVYILFYAGLRRGEMLALTINDIDLAKRRIFVNKTLVGNYGIIQQHTKTKAGMRQIPIADELYEVLAEYCPLAGNGFLFLNSKGKLYRSGAWSYLWQRIMTAIFGDDYPREITPHVFRHNYCSDLCRAGVPVRTAMYLMGHSSMNMTMELYSHASAEDVDLTALNIYYQLRASNRKSKPRKPLKIRSLA